MALVTGNQDRGTISVGGGLCFDTNQPCCFRLKVSGTDPYAVAMLQEQFGGANGELAAMLQYLVQSFAAPDPATRALLMNIAAEEASHLEIVGTAIVTLMTLRQNARADTNIPPSAVITGERLRTAPSMDGQSWWGGPLVADSAGSPFTGNYISATGDMTL